MDMIYKGIALFALIQLTVSSEASAVSSEAGEECPQSTLCDTLQVCLTQICRKYPDAVCYTKKCGDCQARFRHDDADKTEIGTAEHCKADCMTLAIKNRFSAECELPFTYNDIEYTGCTRVNSATGHPWCYTNTMYGNWDYCHITKECPAKTHFCKSETEEKCIFPFTYERKTYNECTIIDSDRLWCVTSGKEGWAYCDKTEESSEECPRSN